MAGCDAGTDSTPVVSIPRRVRRPGGQGRHRRRPGKPDVSRNGDPRAPRGCPARDTPPTAREVEERAGQLVSRAGWRPGEDRAVKVWDAEQGTLSHGPIAEAEEEKAWQD